MSILLRVSSHDLASTNSPREIIIPAQEKDTGNHTRASWKASEQQVLPHNRLWIVFPGLMCCVFLAAVDQVSHQLSLFPVCSLQQTIIATTLPTIVERLGQGKNYSWVGRYLIFLLPYPGLIPTSSLSSYLLAASALAPLFGKLSDLVGRKPVLYFAILSFLVGDLTSPQSACLHGHLNSWVLRFVAPHKT